MPGVPTARLGPHRLRGGFSRAIRWGQRFGCRFRQARAVIHNKNAFVPLSAALRVQLTFRPICDSVAAADGGVQGGTHVIAVIRFLYRGVQK